VFSLGGALCEKLSARGANENDVRVLFYFVGLSSRKCIVAVKFVLILHFISGIY
jgi:hypothetical protein